MRSTIISLGLFKHTGGPAKTVRDFKSALGGELYAFCNPRILKDHTLAVDDARPVVASSLPVFSQFCYAKKNTLEARAVISESSIVSCHGFYRYHALWTCRICKSFGVPYSFVPHGILDPWVMKKNRWLKYLYRKLGGQHFLQDAAVVIFSTQAERDKAINQFELPESKVIPWAVKSVDMTNREEKRAGIRLQLSIPDEAHVLLYFGRVHKMKRPLETIEAMAKVRSVNMHLVIVGNEDGITKEKCMQFARNHELETRVHFVGSIYGEEKYDYMFASDAYISLSFRENFNYTAAESLAAGLPVILSPGNDLRGELSGVGCCLEVEDDSLKSAVKAIENFRDISQSKLREMGMLGRKWIEENLSFDLFKTRLLELHRKYAKNNS